MKKLLFIFLLQPVLLIQLSTASAQTNHRVFYNGNATFSLLCDSDIVWQGCPAYLLKRNINTGQITAIYSNANCGIPLSYINGIAKDQNGWLWLATSKGLVKFKEPGIFTLYDMSNTPMTSNGITTVTVDQNNNIWCAYFGSSTGGIAKFDGTNWTVYTTLNSPLPGEYIKKIKFDGLGNLWMATQAYGGPGGLAKFDGTNWTVWNSTNSIIYQDYLRDLCINASNVVYFSDGEGVFKITGGNLQLITNAYWEPQAVTIDQNQNLWFSNDDPINNMQIVKYDGSAFQNYTASLTGLTSYGTGCFAVDMNNDLWIGTGGLQKLSGSTWQLFYHDLPPNAYMTDVVPEYNGKLWVGSGFHLEDFGGLGSYDGTEWTSYTRYNSALQDDAVRSLAKDGVGNLWIGTNGKHTGTFLYKYDGVNFTVPPFPGTSIVDNIIADTANNVWLNSSTKLYKYDGTSFTVYDTSNIPGMTANGWIKALVCNRLNNHKWIAVLNAPTDFSLFQFNDTAWTKYDCPYPAQVRDLTIDKYGVCWASTSAGVVTFDGTNWNQYTTSNSGLVDNSALHVLATQSGRYYIATISGINLFDGTYWWPLPSSFNDIGFNWDHKLNCDKYENLYFPDYGSLHIFNMNKEGITFPWDLNKIAGKVYYDTNQDGIEDSTEIGLGGQKLLIVPDSSIYITAMDGSYTIPVDYGNYTDNFIPRQSWSLTSDSASFYVFTDTSYKCCYDFGTAPDSLFHGLEAHLTMGHLRCGFDAPFFINYKNTGTLIDSGKVELVLDTAVSFINSNPAQSSLSANVVSWNFSNLQPGEERQIFITVNVHNQPGVQVCSASSIARDNGGSYSIQYTDTLCDEITCSFDPNDKTVSPAGYAPPHYILKTDTLEYTIRFQNMGNDTAFTVRIKDTLDANLDVNSIRVIGYSFPVITSVNPQGVVTFSFVNIQLPSKDTNEFGSQGFVKFSIVPKQGLADGTIIKNTAQIYFDFNEPVSTNEVYSTLVTIIPFGIASLKQYDNISVFPIPFSDEVNLRFTPRTAGIFNLNVYDITGKSVITKNIIVDKADIDSWLRLSFRNYPAGIYFFRIVNYQRDIQYSGKLVKEN